MDVQGFKNRQDLAELSTHVSGFQFHDEAPTNAGVCGELRLGPAFVLAALANGLGDSINCCQKAPFHAFSLRLMCAYGNMHGMQQTNNEKRQCHDST